MLTHWFALTIYRRLIDSPDGFLASPDGQTLTDKGAELIREKCGEQEAIIFRGLMDAAILTDTRS